MKRLHGIVPVLLAALALSGGVASASGDSGRPKPGIDQKHGAMVPLDVPFLDEEGKPVVLREIVRGPTLLLPVYYRCQNICNPTLRALQRALDQLDLRPGKDFDIVTFSIDEADTPELARITRQNLLAGLKRPVDPSGWRVLTGKPE
ncbi:MAG: SCO family protein, partial [Planctomycetia bacterium]|nr:SCO family protein [Planctomycetia bacterium]